MEIRLGAVLLATILAAPQETVAQNQGGIDEIVITAPRGDTRVSGPTLVLDNAALVERQPVVVSDIFKNFTGISLRTNSRGDSVVRIRGAEERQTLVFLDGAPLATPWDGRADLSLLPAGLIDRVEVTRGAAPIEYGANAVAGAIDLVTFLPDEDRTVRAEVQRGSLGLHNINLLAGVGLDNGLSFVAGGAYVDRDAVRIADKQSIAFDPATNRRRTNTDLSGRTGYGAVAYAGDSALFRLSFLHADVERGVAAQSDIDPSVTSPRFWRTPNWQLSQLTFNGQWRFGPRQSLRLTAWQQDFEQTIDAYTDYSYTTLRDRENGDDLTVGARLGWSMALSHAALRVVATAQESTHHQVDSATATGSADDFVADPELRYRQRIATAGIEVDLNVTDNLLATFGIGVDRAETPLTGDKPPQASLSATGWSSGLKWSPSEHWSLAANLGQRSRFPTPRELYGVALGRFLLNPNLKPERSLLGDIQLELAANDVISVDSSIWVNHSDDTLSQRVVDVAGVNRRQRYNTNGSLTYGIESSAILRPADTWRIETSIALQDGKVERDDNGNRPVLTQRPKAQASIAFDWQARQSLDVRAELFYTGRSFDLGDNGETVRLPSSTRLNLRAFVSLGEWRGQDLLLTAAADNVADALELPQLGLPAPGRSFHVGLRIN